MSQTTEDNLICAGLSVVLAPIITWLLALLIVGQS
jgi:uncharacterized protein YsxB (DUF464 family)